jgi:hypothetical protein
MKITIELTPTQFTVQNGGHEKPMEIAIKGASPDDIDLMKTLAACAMSARGEDWAAYYATAHLPNGQVVDLW